MTLNLKTTDESSSRFSDDKLFQFQREFRAHVDNCNKRFNDGDEQFLKLIEAQQKNTDSISSLIEETRSVVQLYKDIQGATRLGKGLQSFLSWVIKWPLIGAGLYAIIVWVIKHPPS